MESESLMNPPEPQNPFCTAVRRIAAAPSPSCCHFVAVLSKAMKQTWLEGLFSLGVLQVSTICFRDQQPNQTNKCLSYAYHLSIRSPVSPKTSPMNPVEIPQTADDPHTTWSRATWCLLAPPPPTPPTHRCTHKALTLGPNPHHLFAPLVKQKSLTETALEERY